MEGHVFITWDIIDQNDWYQYETDEWIPDEDETGVWIPDTDGDGEITLDDFGAGGSDSELRPSQQHTGG